MSDTNVARWAFRVSKTKWTFAESEEARQRIWSDRVCRAQAGTGMVGSGDSGDQANPQDEEAISGEVKEVIGEKAKEVNIGLSNSSLQAKQMVVEKAT